MTTKRCELSRRNFLQAGVFGLTGLTWSDYLRAADAARVRSTADSILFVNLAGGPSHLDTLDMKPEGPAETRGEFSAVQTSIPGLVACQHMPKIAAAMNQVTLIRGISHTVGDHPQGQNYISTGNRPGPALKYPSYGSIVSKEKEEANDPDMPPYVAIPQTEWNAGHMGDGYAPFKTNATPKPGQPFDVRGISLPDGVTLETVARRDRLLRDVDSFFDEADLNSPLLDAMDAFGQRAYKMITSARTRDAFDVSREPASIQQRFDADDLGQSLLLAVRLIEFGVPFVTVTNSGWDTHLDNFKGHARLIPPLDSGLTATLAALEEKGLLDRTLVVVMGEFGRTPKINPNVGRDHYPRANWCLMAGGGAQAGQLIGGTDDGGTGPDDSTSISPDDLGATILHAIGIDHHKEYTTRAGRPVGLVPLGNVIEDAFG